MCFAATCNQPACPQVQVPTSGFEASRRDHRMENYMAASLFPRAGSERRAPNSAVLHFDEARRAPTLAKVEACQVNQRASTGERAQRDLQLATPKCQATR
jgi:hypothetical protein